MARKALEWLRTNAIALASLVVAGGSLWLTYIVQKRDLDYKELSIRPSLVVSYDTSDFSYKLENAGLGPAIIKKLVFRFGATCFDAFKLGLTQTYALQLLLTDHFYIRPVQATGVPIEVPIPQATGVHANTMFFRKEHTLPVGRHLELFVLSKEQASLLTTKLAELSAEEQNGVFRNFGRAALTLPWGGVYCSLSEQYCRTVPLKGCVLE